MEQREYVQRLLDAYRATPGTTGMVRTLALARRLARPTDAPALSVIRSLAYFSPVIEEVLQTQPSPQYFHHLRQRIQQLASTR